MPRFFFDILDGAATTTDPIGLELANAALARDEATRTLCEIVAQEVSGTGNSTDKMFSIAVSDSARTVLFEVSLAFSTKEYDTSKRGNDHGSGD